MTDEMTPRGGVVEPAKPELPAERTGGGRLGAAPPVSCEACGLPTFRRLCHFCTRTVDLIKRRRCVSCTGAVLSQDSERVQGKCAECLGRNAPVCSGTRWLLKQAAAVRYQQKAA